MSNTITVYVYDWVLKEYLFSELAEESPLEPGTYLIPNNATPVVPPTPVDGTLTIFNESTNQWEQLEDHRGEKWYNSSKELTTIDFLGKPEDKGYIKELPPPVLTFEEKKANKIQELATLRFTKETGGVTVNGVPMQTDRASASVLNAAVVRTLIDPNRITNWKGPDGSEIQLDATTLQAIGMSIGDYVQACFDRELALLSSINTTTTEVELDAIDITTGWPSTVL